MNKKLPKIKPCPFCGGEAAIDFTHDGCGLTDGVIVQCLTCGASTTYFDYFNDKPPLEEVKEEAIAAWNRRVKDNETD